MQSNGFQVSILKNHEMNFLFLKSILLLSGIEGRAQKSGSEKPDILFCIADVALYQYILSAYGMTEGVERPVFDRVVGKGCLFSIFSKWQLNGNTKKLIKTRIYDIKAFDHFFTNNYDRRPYFRTRTRYTSKRL